MNAPIALFTFNRLKHTKATVEALLKNNMASQSDLWIFSDGANSPENEKLVQNVRQFLHTITGFKTLNVVERGSNFGLGNNIISGVTQVVEQFGKIIVLEDDLITSPHFLQYMNDGLEVYNHADKVASIHGYVYPVKETLEETFFLRGADCLGWGTWQRSWNKFERNGELLLEKLISTHQTYQFDYNGAYPYTQLLKDQISGSNSSWAVRWYASAFLNDLYTLYPARSLVLHAGGDGTGTNTGFDKLLDVKLSMQPVYVKLKNVTQDELAFQAFTKVLKKINRPPLLYRLKRKWNKIKINSQRNQ